MGYTHYWEAGTKPDTFVAAYPDIQLDAVRICKHAQTVLGVNLADGLGAGDRPIITEGVLALNGSEAFGEDYETFALRPQLGAFDFCKTAHRPYDVVVTAILLRAAHHAPEGIKVSSDGDWDEWKPARTLVEELFGDTPTCPW